MTLDKYTEGDARKGIHARACAGYGNRSGKGFCRMSCSCWCHGLTKHTNGDTRPDAAAAAEMLEAEPHPAAEQRDAKKG